MSRRRLLLLSSLVLVLALLAASSPAALAAYGPLWSQPVNGAARLVAGDAGVTVVWAVADGARHARSSRSATTAPASRSAPRPPSS